MKQLKMFALAAIAALGLMAFGGAGTASATTLFTDSAETIDYPAGTVLEDSLVSGTSFTFKDTSTNTLVTCTSFTTKWKSLNTTGTWIELKLESVSLSCDTGTIPITFGVDKIDHVSATSGEVIGSGTSITVKIFGVSCTYGTGEGTKLGTLSSGSAPELVVNAAIPRIAGGFLCPSTSTWSGRFILTSPHALTVGP